MAGMGRRHLLCPPPSRYSRQPARSCCSASLCKASSRRGTEPSPNHPANGPSEPTSNDAAPAQFRDRRAVVAKLAQNCIGVLALVWGGAKLARLRVAAHVDRLADNLLRTELGMTDRSGDPQMPDLRIGKGLIDRIDRAARYADLAEQFDPIGVRVLPNDLIEMGIERRPVPGAGDDRREI